MEPGTGILARTEKAFLHYPEFLEWSPNGEFIAAGSMFAPAMMFGIKHGWRVRGFNDGFRIFNSLAWSVCHRSDDGNLLQIVGDDGLKRL